MCTLIELSTCSPWARFGDGRRHTLRLCIDLREALDRVVLRDLPGLFALLAERVLEANRVRVRAAGGLGAVAVLEEGAHAAGELSSHVSNLPSGSEEPCTVAAQRAEGQQAETGLRRMLTFC